MHCAVLNVFSIMEKDAAIVGASNTTATVDGLTKKDLSNEFYNTGRVGRRNALPDILGSHSTTTTADLPDRLGALTTEGTSFNR